MLRHDLLRHIFERLQMRRRIAIPKRMISDESDAVLEKRAEGSKVRHAASMQRRHDLGKEHGLDRRRLSSAIPLVLRLHVDSLPKLLKEHHKSTS